MLENILTEYKQLSFCSFKKDVPYKLFAYKPCIYKQDLIVNDPWGLICHPEQPNKPKFEFPWLFITNSEDNITVSRA